MKNSMRKLLAGIPYFLEAASHASFTQAADALGIPLATLSRRIAAMEQALGVKLFFRNTRLSHGVYSEKISTIMTKLR